MPNDHVIKIAIKKLDTNELGSALERRVEQEGKYHP